MGSPWISARETGIESWWSQTGDDKNPILTSTEEVSMTLSWEGTFLPTSV